MKKTGLLPLGFSFLAFNFCHAQKKIEFKTDPATGVQYHFVKQSKNGAKPADTDFAKVIMVYENDKDSVLLDSHKKGGDSAGVLRQGIPLKKTFNGCLEQGIMMMSVGDSAIFRVNADSLFLKTFHTPPARVPTSITYTTFYTFYIKLAKFETRQEMMDDAMKERQKYEDRIKMRKTTELTEITAYLTKNYPNAKPNADSLFILSQTAGGGKQIMEGDSVEMAYIGSFLDGTEFDKSSQTRGSGFKFVYTNHASLIKGWLNILPTLHEGDKVKVLIPSASAYGPRGYGQKILPYTPLIFEMTVLHVSSNSK